MIARFALAALALLALCAPAHAQANRRNLTAAVTEDTIEVTSDFRGARVVVYGASPQQRGGGDLVVVIRGPASEVTVMRKRRILGLWLNTDPVRFTDTPTFFAVLSAKPLEQIAATDAIWSLKLDPAAQARLATATPADADPGAYRRGLVRLKQSAGLYTVAPRGLDFPAQGLFRAPVALPPNAPPGVYTVDIYLFRRLQLIASEQAKVTIARTGVERTIHDLAQKRPFLYGLLTVAMALGAGWLATAAFRRR